MASGPASANVYQNAYGALRELDYLYHLPKDNQRALDFSFDKVYYLDEGIGDTYLINNTNKAGVVFQNIEDITDSIGRCMFLPSNEVDSVKDNTDNVSFVYNIRDKEAHYVSAGSACSTHKPEPSATLKSIGLDKSLLDSTLRFSMSEFTTPFEVDETVKALGEIVPMLRRFTRR